MTTRITIGLICSLCLLIATGCGGGKPDSAPPPDGSTTLNEVIGLIRNFSSVAGKGPTKAADFTPYEAGYPLGMQAVRSGAVVVVWGSMVAGEGGGGGDGVVAYEKDVPTAGGFVAFQNGTVKKMTVEEYKAAPKAGGK